LVGGDLLGGFLLFEYRKHGSNIMDSSGKISLNFFPLTQQEFTFVVYRKPYEEGTKKEIFPDCSRRRLPNQAIDNQEPGSIYIDYWVCFKPLNGFEKFICHSKLNNALTVDFLYFLLKEKCNQHLNKNEFILPRGFRTKWVMFVLQNFSEGNQTVWLEPYYLKIDHKFGFLIDFKFESPSGSIPNRRTLQLSLSLDQEGKSNRNFYVDRFEQIQKFMQKFYRKIFPLSGDGISLFIDRELLYLDAKKLNPKQYVFSNDKKSNSQYSGVKSYGPLEIIKDEPKIYFLYREQDKPFAQDLYKALRGDTFSNTFPGMDDMFGYKFNSENVGGKAIEGYDPTNLAKTLEVITRDAKGRRVLPILIIPYKKGSNPDASRLYHIAKYAFLTRKIPSQFVSLIQLQTKDQLKWSVSNLGLQIFAKMGGKPWKVVPETNNCLIIGIGQAHKENEGKIEKYYAYSVLTESTGLYKDLKMLGQGKDKGSYLGEFKSNLKAIFEQYFEDYDNFVVHATFSIRRDELDIVKEVLDEINQEKDIPKTFVVMKFNDRNKYFGYSMTSNSMIPFESTYVQLSRNEYLVWFEGLQYHNPNVLKRIERPLHIEFIYPKDGLEERQKVNYIQDAVNISGANWRGFNAKSLPVSVYYAYLVADYYKEFQSFGLNDIDIENMNPWFL
jgi:hypothetical protein